MTTFPASRPTSFHVNPAVRSPGSPAAGEEAEATIIIVGHHRQDGSRDMFHRRDDGTVYGRTTVPPGGSAKAPRERRWVGRVAAAVVSRLSNRGGGR